jgi:hypothetical protein
VDRWPSFRPKPAARGRPRCGECRACRDCAGSSSTLYGDTPRKCGPTVPLGPGLLHLACGTSRLSRVRDGAPTSR